ncbi:putative 50S ribosomal protein l36 [Cladochytrium replicatum]|nr:putative 50S ribosomal protein l36 [Cladochytrium replicatum]
MFSSLIRPRLPLLLATAQCPLRPARLFSTAAFLTRSPESLSLTQNHFLPSSTVSARPKSPLLNSSAFWAVPVRTYKVKSALKLRCEHCMFVRRRRKLRVICSMNAKHKQRQR